MCEENINESMIDHMAQRQLANYDQRRPWALFSDETEWTIDQGYALQTAVTDLRLNRGENVVGYKIGCTSPTIRSQLGIDHSIMGSLFDTEQHQSGAILSGHSYAHLACEGELAVELSRPPCFKDFQSDGIPDCVTRVFPVIELHHYVNREKIPNAAELIATNAMHAGVVAGHGVKMPIKSTSPSLSIYQNDTLLDTCSTLALMATIRSSLLWLMHHLSVQDVEMKTGQIILTGSVLPLFPINETCHFRVESEPFGTVETLIQYEGEF